MVISQTVKPNVQEDIDYVIAHPHVIRWFIQNLDLYGGNNYNSYTQPTKVDPFPYRIQERLYGDKKPKQLFMKQYKDVFMIALNQEADNNGNLFATTVPKIYASYLACMQPGRKRMNASLNGRNSTPCFCNTITSCPQMGTDPSGINTTKPWG